MGRYLVILQLDMLYFVDNHGISFCPFLNRKGGGTDWREGTGWGEGMGRRNAARL